MDFEIKDLKKIFKLAGVIVLVLFLIVCLFNSFYTVKEQEKAVVITFGNATDAVGSGLHFKVPFIQNIKKVNTTIRGLAVGYDEKTNEAIPDEANMITGDYNFVNVDFYIEWKVADPIKALYASQEPVFILKNIAQSSARTVVSAMKVDDVLTTGKTELESKVEELMMTELSKFDLGIQVVNVTIQDVEPPTDEIMKAFKSVETAKQDKETMLNNANKYQNEQLPTARATADKIVQDAESEKASRINEANGQVARFNQMFEQYIKYPDITKKRMFFETMEAIMPNLKVIIDYGDGTQRLLPLDTLATVNGGTTSATGSGN